MLFDRIQKGWREARFYRLYLQSMPDIKKWQDDALCDLIHHAERNIPMWNTILKERVGSAAAIRNTDDLRLLPIIGKKDFMGKVSEEYTDNSGAIRTTLHTTSGSTGIPFEFYTGDKYFHPYYSNFAHFRFLAQQGRGLQSLSETRSALLQGTLIPKRNQLFLTISDLLQDTNDSIAKIADFKPEVLISSPSLLLKLAQAVAKKPLGALHIPYVNSTSEMLSPTTRTFIESNLRSEVYDRYSTEEVGTISMECHRHNGQHLHPESVIVEIVDMNGDPTPEGNEGRVIVTDLLNYNMPFIRYDTGDRGIMTTTRCECGLYSPRIWIMGRYAGSLDFNGHPIHRIEFEKKLRYFMASILQFQIVKSGVYELTVRIIPTLRFDSASAGKIKEALQPLVGKDIMITIDLISAIKTMPSGKSQTIVDESQSAPKRDTI